MNASRRNAYLKEKERIRNGLRQAVKSLEEEHTPIDDAATVYTVMQNLAYSYGELCRLGNKSVKSYKEAN